MHLPFLDAPAGIFSKTILGQMIICGEEGPYGLPGHDAVRYR